MHNSCSTLGFRCNENKSDIATDDHIAVRCIHLSRTVVWITDNAHVKYIDT